MTTKPVNVADMLGKTFEALNVQCNTEKGIITCEGEKNPDFNTGTRADWTVTVDQVVMQNISRASVSNRGVWIMPRGGKKYCALEHGNGIGTVELVCSEDLQTLKDTHRPMWGPGYASQDKDLKNRNLMFLSV